MSKERIKSIDFCKGIAILLVVLGHATEHTNASLSYDWLYEYIYSFHMPLFMFISGFVFYKNKYNWIDIKKRAYQLLVPFFVYQIIVSLIFSGNFSYATWFYNIKSPGQFLWYLLVLFYITTFFTILNIIFFSRDKNDYITNGVVANRKFDNKDIIIVLITIVISGFCLFIAPRVIKSTGYDYGLNLFSRFIIFFLLGLLTRKYFNENVKSFYLKWWWLWLVIWIVTSTVSLVMDSCHNNVIILEICDKLAAFSGTFMVFGLCLRYVKQDNNNKIVNMITQLGTMTLGIYCVHRVLITKPLGHFLTDLGLSYALSMPLTFIGSMLFSVILVKIIEKCIILPQLLLGKVNVNKK